MLIGGDTDSCAEDPAELIGFRVLVKLDGVTGDLEIPATSRPRGQTA